MSEASKRAPAKVVHGYAYILNISSLRDLKGDWEFYFYKYIAPLGQVDHAKSRSDDIFVERHKKIFISPSVPPCLPTR